MATKPYEFIGFGAMEVTKPYEFIGFGAMEVTKPYEFIGFGAMEVTNTYEFIGFGAMEVTKPYKFRGSGGYTQARIYPSMRGSPPGAPGSRAHPDTPGTKVHVIASAAVFLFWVPEGSLAGILWVGFWGLGGCWGHRSQGLVNAYLLAPTLDF